MQEAEFRNYVLQHEKSGLTRDSLEFAIDRCVREGRTADQKNVSGCIELARTVQAFHRNQLAKNRDAELVQVLVDPATSLPSQAILEEIAPWVESVRWLTFRCEAQPFMSYEAAITWLVKAGNEQESERQQRRRSQLIAEIGNNPDWQKQHPEAGPIRIYEAEEDPDDACLRECKRRLEGLWRISETRRELPYKTADDAYILESERSGYEYVRQTFPEIFKKMFPPGKEHVWSIPVFPGTPLFMLEEAAHGIAEITGFLKVDVVAYILAGVKPTLSPLVLRTVSPEPHGLLADMEHPRTWAVIEVRDTVNINSEQWGDVYRLLRKRFGVKHFNRLTPSDQRLYDLVQELGGIPSHGKKAAFWERVRQQWNSEAAKEQYTVARGLTIRYGRILEKLDTHRQEIEEISSENISAP